MAFDESGAGEAKEKVGYLWLGTHKKYNEIDAKTIGYDKTHKK